MHKARALIVDHDPFMVRLIETLIARSLVDHLECDTTSDASEALELIAADRYDLVLTDLEMPGAGSCDVLRAARRRDPWTRVIVIVDDASLDRMDTAFSLGASDYLRKPIHPVVMREILEQHIEQRTRWEQAASRLKKVSATA